MSFYLWIMTSLLAIATIGTHPELGLAIALLGGLAVGLNGVATMEKRGRKASVEKDR